MEAYIAKYGYIGIFIGTFLEGETTVLLGGISSKLGYMTRYEEYIIPAVLIGVIILIMVYRLIVKEREKSYGD